jgi:hypothetical protein
VRPADLPDDRPDGLELVRATGPWFRFDRQPPAGWAWDPFPTPRHRFDSISGSHRVRYGGTEFYGAARERFDGSGRVISRSDHDHWLVELTGVLQVADLRFDDTLDALGVDDRVNTGRLALDRRDGDDVLDTCGTLTDRLVGWFGTDVHGIVHRSRTTPQRSTNLAWFAHAPLTVASSVQVRDIDDDRLANLVVLHRFHLEGLLGA